MFLGYQNGKIVLAAATREALENAPCMTFERIEETAREYVLWGGEYVLKEQAAELETAAIRAEDVAALEAQTGLTRAVRELVLAENSGAREYVKSKAQEIEALAAPMRQTPEPDAGEISAAETEAAVAGEKMTEDKRWKN